LTAKEGRIHLYNQMFLDETARGWHPSGAAYKQFSPSAPVLFVCDIRSADHDVMAADEVERRVADDMAAQRRWTEIMTPSMASLKFRLPWVDGETEYPAGDIYYQVWAGVTSTESRLFTDGKVLTRYDNKLYEGQLFFYNTVTRLSLHPHNVQGVAGLDHCADCAAEVAILQHYIEKKGLPEHKQYTSTALGVGALMTMMTTGFLAGRTLEDHVDPATRKQYIVKNQWVNGKPAYLAEIDDYLAGASFGEMGTAAELAGLDLAAEPAIAEMLALMY
jgi:hypothetical protein